MNKISIAEAAAITGYSRQTLYKWIKAKILPAEFIKSDNKEQVVQMVDKEKLLDILKIKKDLSASKKGKHEKKRAGKIANYLGYTPEEQNIKFPDKE